MFGRNVFWTGNCCFCDGYFLDDSFINLEESRHVAEVRGTLKSELESGDIKVGVGQQVYLVSEVLTHRKFLAFPVNVH